MEIPMNGTFVLGFAGLIFALLAHTGDAADRRFFKFVAALCASFMLLGYCILNLLSVFIGK